MVQAYRHLLTFIVVVGFIGVLGFGEAYGAWWSSTREPREIRFASGENIHLITVADTRAERARGFSGRAMPAKDTGILFIFPTPTLPAFWMKEMLFPIDIVWIDSTRTVIGVTPMIATSTYPETFSPPRAIRYALEVPAGSARTIATGTRAYFSF